MIEQNNIRKELLELNSSLVNLTNQNTYSVPDGYFEGLVMFVLRRIRAFETTTPKDELKELSPMLSSISRQMPYAVPAGYFDQLPSLVLQQTGADSVKEELESLSPFLGSLKKENPYSVPQGYFDNIQTRKIEEPAKVISIVHRQWFRMAAAAVITGLFLLAGFLFFNNKPASGGQIAKVNKIVKKMNDSQKDELMDLMDAGFNSKETAKTNVDVKTKEIRDLLQDIPAEELKDFQEQSEDVQEVLMTN